MNNSSYVAPNLKEAIIEALKSMSGCGTISDVSEYILSKYGERWKDIATTMADLCPESKSSTYSQRDRVLNRVGRGKYCLREFSSQISTKVIVEIHKPQKFPELKVGLSIYSYNQAEEILKQKDQLPTIIDAASLTDLKSKEDHDKIIQFLNAKGWEIETSSIFPVSSYRIDAFREKTGIEVERSLIDAIHRSLFRCVWSYHNKKLDVLVLIVPMRKEPSFENVKRDIEVFKEIIPYPIYLVGVS